jgi:hypothetical protein
MFQRFGYQCWISATWSWGWGIKGWGIRGWGIKGKCWVI